MTPVVAYLCLRLVSESNAREHWSVKAKRVQDQRATTRDEMKPRVAHLRAWLGSDPDVRIHVLVTRVGKRKLDSDNLQGSAKAVRDGVIDALCPCPCHHCKSGHHAQHGRAPCVDDDDQRVTFDYAQSVGASYAVRLEVRGRVESTQRTPSADRASSLPRVAPVARHDPQQGGPATVANLERRRATHEPGAKAVDHALVVAPARPLLDPRGGPYPPSLVRAAEALERETPGSTVRGTP